jgi:O-antigen/teichoic acid export membrane protein
VSSTLTARTLRGFAWTFTGSAGKAVLQICSTVVLARLLTPEDFGSVAAALLVVTLTQLVTQLGVAPALVHRKELTDDEVSAAYLFSLLVSVVFAAGLYLAAPWINGLVGLPRESGLVRLVAVTLVLAGAAAVPTGLLQRSLRFRSTAVVDLLAAGPARLGVSVGLALLGFGAEALAWAEIVAALVTAVGYSILARPAVRLMSPARVWHNLRPMIGFGSGHSITQLGNWTALNADNLVVANLLGTGALGVYTRAYNLLTEPANVLGGAADKALFPAMARVRDDAERLRTAYVRSVSLLTLVTAPVSVLLVVLAPEVVHVLLGGQWDAVIVPLQVFALVLVPRTAYKISTSLTRATGAVYRAAWRQWLYAAEVVAFSIAGALTFGINGVAIGAATAVVLHFLVMLRFSARISPGLSRQILTRFLVHLPASAAVLAASWATAATVRPLGSDLLTLVLAGGAGAASGALVVVLLRGRFRDELEVLSRRHGPARPGPA